MTFSIGTATQNDIYQHLDACKSFFVPSLDSTVNLEAYAQKLFEKSVTFESWKDEALIGLIAAYFNDLNHRKGFITSVSVLPSFYGLGIAKTLLINVVNYGKGQGFKLLELEVNTGNKSAFQLYAKDGFVPVIENGTSLKMIKQLV